MQYSLLQIIAIGLVAIPSSLLAAETPKPNTDGFQKTVVPLFRKYCVDCHGATDPEAKLSLTALKPNLFDGQNLETWRMIDEQIRYGDMPPKDADQLTTDERSMVLNWIRQEMWKTQMPAAVTEEKLLLPQFGNYVEHDFLFGRRLPRVYPAPPRIWRLRPSRSSRLGGRFGWDGIRTSRPSTPAFGRSSATPCKSDSFSPCCWEGRPFCWAC